MNRSMDQIGRISALAAVSVSMCLATGCKKDPNVEKQKYLESGIRYENDHKLKEASIQFANAIRIDHNFSPAHYELAKTYLEMGTLMQSYQEFVRTVDLDPANVKARISLGTMLVAGGVPDRALDQVKAVFAQDPNNADAFALRAQVEQQKGDHAAALADTQPALSIDPQRSSYYTLLATLQSQSPAPPMDQVQAELRKAVELDPHDVSARVTLSSLLEKDGNRAAAEQQLIDAEQNSPKDLGLRKALAAFYERAGDQAKAEQTLRKATEDLSETDEGANALSNYYFSHGQMAKADQAYAELTKQQPKNTPLQIAYAQVLLNTQQFDKARVLLAELSKNHDRNPQVQVLNALMLMKDGKVNDAFALLQKATRDSPNNASLQLLLARVAAVKGDASTQEAAYRIVTQLDPSNLDAETGLAEIATRRGDSTLLAQLAENTIALHPNFAPAYLWRGSAEANQKQYEQAELDFQTALKKDPNSSIALMEMGQLKTVQGHAAEGNALIEQAFAKDPNNKTALSLLVQSDLAAKQPAKALARLQQEIARSPNNSVLYTDLANLQIGTKDYAGALGNAKKGMELDPSNEGGVQAFSQAQVALGNPDQAITAWEFWLKNHPNDSKATLVLGTLEEGKGDIAQAMDFYKQTMQIVPGQPVAANNLAYLMVESGQNSDVALTMAQTARRAIPDSPSTADTLAWVYYYKGIYPSALDLLQDAVKADPGDPSIQYHLGMTYAKMGDKTNALLHLKKAVELKPTSKSGQDAQNAINHL